jgi:hypothetical protein
MFNCNKKDRVKNGNSMNTFNVMMCEWQMKGDNKNSFTLQIVAFTSL